jgi:hypothetical protein
VKRIVAILFLLMYLFTATEIRQFFKLDSFIAHYYEHKAEDPALTFLEFLDIHYGHGNVIDDDYAKDMKLPFKTTASDFSTVQIAHSFNLSFSTIKIANYKSSTESIIKEVFLTPSYLSSIWQPPRTV